jgi:glycosyltransferase involved in cell wall biosynthesis
MTHPIFVLPRGAEPGGITTWSIQMAHALNAIGLEPKLLKHQALKGSQEDPIPAHVKTLACPGKAAWGVNWADVSDYLPTYAQALPGTFIPNWTFGTYAACALLSLTAADKMRVLGWAHSDDAIHYVWLKHYEPIIHRFVAVSAEIASQLQTLMPHRKDDIEVRPCAIDVPSQWTKTETTPNQPIRLMFAGRVQNQQKRVYDLFRLSRLLWQKGVDFRLDIVGDGSDRAWLENQFTLLLGNRTQEVVTFFGNLPHADMPSHWQAADLCLLVSDFEGTSISMLEAMAQGCVPLVTQVSGTRAVIQEGVNGFTVPVGDMDAMANRIADLSADRARLMALSQAAHQTALTKFAFPDYLSWFIALNETVWQQAPRQWPLGKCWLPPEAAPYPKLSLSQKLSNRVERLTGNAQLMLKIHGYKAIPQLLSQLR